jgi:hypothetical protein
MKKLIITTIIAVALPVLVSAEEKSMRNTNPSPIPQPDHVMRNTNPSPQEMPEHMMQNSNPNRTSTGSKESQSDAKPLDIQHLNKK